ncbi:MAG: UDP-N-acetylglucosamine 2-epimerase, partial [Pseudomonadales bacterium]|nr:UDP-N-acetylglucosamine 2-epimerase [Pseudomonadales bacterium]
MAKRKVAVLTGTRAEYGLLRPLIAELLKRTSLDVGLFVTGAHLAYEFGYTVKEIESDGFPIWERIESVLASDTPAAICRSMALGCIGVSDALTRHDPDLLVLLGDRTEVLAAAQAALIHRVPLAHLHGGEATEGLIDEGIRHAVTKMAHLHFVAAEPFRQKVLRMGEDPSRIFTTGALGVDNALSLPPVGRGE